VVNWAFDNGFDPTAVSEVRLVRQELAHPTDETDGTTVHTEVNPGGPNYFATTSCADLAVSDGTVYYYRMFSYVTAESAWRWTDLASGYALAFTTGAVSTKMWDYLVGMDQAGDAETTQDSLLQTTIPIADPVHEELSNPLQPGQQLHFGAHEVATQKGFLFRLLRLLGTEFDRVHALTRHVIPVLGDVDVCPLDMLPVLGSRVGVEVDVETSPARRRMAIRNAVPVYQVKGTRDGIATAIKILIPWDIQFDECGDNIGVYNREDRKYWLDTNVHLMGTVTDPTTYYPGTGRYERSFTKVRVFFISPGPTYDSLSRTQIQKVVNRVIPANLQASHQAIPVFVPSKTEEEAQLSIEENERYDLKTRFTGDGVLNIEENEWYTWTHTFLLTGASGVANRVVSDPQWVTPKVRTP
jgi:phage tail-like protein